MSRIKQEVKETITKTKVIGIRCDRCGRETIDTSSNEINWGEDFEQDITSKLVCLQGSVYPEGGTLEGYEVHLCPDCWDKIITPVVREFAQPVEVDW